MTTAAVPALELFAEYSAIERLQLNCRLAEQVLGWRWFVYTPAYIEQLHRNPNYDGPVHHLRGAKFLAEPKWGEHQVQLGQWMPAPPGAPISNALALFVPLVTAVNAYALQALERCEYYRVHKTGEEYEVMCSRTDFVTSNERPLGRATGKEFAAIAAAAVAQAWGIDL